jgi:hypothetical protein
VGYLGAEFVCGDLHAPFAPLCQIHSRSLHKVYRAPLENEPHYSPAKCIGCDMKTVSGNPDYKPVSTSFVERQNWTGANDDAPLSPRRAATCLRIPK